MAATALKTAHTHTGLSPWCTIRACLTLLAILPFADGESTRNIILVTADGLRWQEVFHGIDPLLGHEKSAGMDKAEDRRKYERPTEQQRREALMPFFWTQIAPKAAVFSNVKVTNGIRVSYPGYSEILTGRSEDRLIHNNVAIRNPNETVLEFLWQKLRLSKQQVALFARENFPPDRGAHRRLHCNQRRLSGHRFSGRQPASCGVELNAISPAHAVG